MAPTIAPNPTQRPAQGLKPCGGNHSGVGKEVRRITTYKPGNIVPISGQYGVVDAFGIYLGVERTCVKGEPFPPITTSGGVGYVLRDATAH